MIVRPFPWGSLEAVSRDDARAARALRSWGGRLAREAALEIAARAVLGAHVEVTVDAVRANRDATRAARSEGDVAVLLGGEGTEPSTAVLVEGETALAAALVARAIRREPPKIPSPETAPSSAIAGAFAAIVVAVARRAHGSIVPRVLGAGSAAGFARNFEAAVEERIEVTLTVRVDGEAFRARVTAPRTPGLAAAAAPFTAEALAALDALPLGLPIVAAATLSTAADIGTLRRGDAWMPGAWRLTRASSGDLVGPVLLAAAAGEIGFAADFGEDGRLVLRGGVSSLAWDDDHARRAGEHVSEMNEDALVEAVGEVPVVVRVEIGVAEMRAREWAAIGRGDVIAVGKRIGDGVTLRVGGVTVARGELVDLDGEIGVRILGRAEDR